MLNGTIQKWNNIPQAEINTLVNSLQWSIQEVVIPVIKCFFFKTLLHLVKIASSFCEPMTMIFASSYVQAKLA